MLDARGRHGGGVWRERGEAGERVVLTTGVELLVADHEAVRAEYPEHEENALVRAAAGALPASVRPVHEHRIGTQAEDVVDAKSELVRDLGEGAYPSAVVVSARVPYADVAVVDELDGGHEDGFVATDVERVAQR